MKVFTLDTIDLLEEATVHSLNCSGQIRRRLLDLGICDGTKITPIFRSITGDSTAYLIRGTLIALRQIDAKKIDMVNN